MGGRRERAVEIVDGARVEDVKVVFVPAVVIDGVKVLEDERDWSATAESQVGGSSRSGISLLVLVVAVILRCLRYRASCFVVGGSAGRTTVERRHSCGFI